MGDVGDGQIRYMGLQRREVRQCVLRSVVAVRWLDGRQREAEAWECIERAAEADEDSQAFNE